MLLASMIDWRNDPVPLSLVFVTVKARGVLGWFVCKRSARVVRVVSCAERPNPTSATEMPVRTIARPKRCEPKKPDRERGYFLMEPFLSARAREVLKT